MSIFSEHAPCNDPLFLACVAGATSIMRCFFLLNGTPYMEYQGKREPTRNRGRAGMCTSLHVRMHDEQLRLVAPRHTRSESGGYLLVGLRCLNLRCRLL